MIKTFTSKLDITEKQEKKAKLSDVIPNQEPSAQTIQTILNYSKNLEILKSTQLQQVELIKS